MLANVVTSRVTTRPLPLLRSPVAWPMYPILTLARREGGTRVGGVLIHADAAPRWRVYYVTRRQAATYTVDELNEIAECVDYRTPEHLLADGWDVV